MNINGKPFEEEEHAKQYIRYSFFSINDVYPNIQGHLSSDTIFRVFRVFLCFVLHITFSPSVSSSTLIRTRLFPSPPNNRLIASSSVRPSDAVGLHQNVVGYAEILRRIVTVAQRPVVDRVRGGHGRRNIGFAETLYIIK